MKHSWGSTQSWQFRMPTSSDSMWHYVTFLSWSVRYWRDRLPIRNYLARKRDAKPVRKLLARKLAFASQQSWKLTRAEQKVKYVWHVWLMYDMWVSCGSLLWPAVTVSTLWGALQAARAVVSTCTPLHARQSDRSTAMHARATQKKEHSDISTSKILESMEGRWAKAGRVPSKLGFKVNFEIDWHD